MPYCPDCGYEYVPGVLICPDCQSPLRQAELTLCDSCDEPVDRDSRFCSHCGIRRKEVEGGESKIVCATHPNDEAMGRCVFCGKLVCDRCAVRRQGRIFCENDEHVKMMFDWVAVWTASTPYEAQMIKANFEGAGIPAMILSQHDRMYYTTAGDLAVNEIMVPKGFLENARQYLQAMDTERAEGQPDA